MTSTSASLIDQAELPLLEKGAVRLLLSHFGRRWRVYVLGGFAVFLTNLTEVAIPKVIQWIIDLVVSSDIPGFIPAQSNIVALRYLIGLVFLILIIQWFGRRMWRRTLGLETHYLAANLKTRLWRSIRFYSSDRLSDDLNIGSLMTAATADVGTARMLFGWTFIGIFDTVFLGVFSVTLMFSINAQLTLYVLAVVPILPFLSYHTARLGEQRYRRAQEKLSSLNESVSQAISTVKMQRLSHTGAIWSRQLVESAEDYRSKRLWARLTFLRYVLLFGLPSLYCYFALFYWGTDAVLAGEVSLGEFVAFLSYVLMLQGPLNELGYIIAEWKRGGASLNRLSDYFNTEPDRNLYPADPQAYSAEGFSGAVIKGESLSFTYPGADKRVLSEVDISLKSGGRLGIHGPVGSGKSTLVKILAGLERRYEGTLELFGHDPREVLSSELRSDIALIDQRPFLFGDTIRSNLSLDRRYTEEELWDLLEVVCLAKDFRELPKGLDTPLGEWGVNLSGGQKQRMTIARALLRKPKLLILDDCLSAVDTLTEEEILKGLDAYLEGVTLIWVAHRASTLRFCDAILELT